VNDLSLLYHDEILLLEDLQSKTTKEEFSKFLEVEQKTSLLHRDGDGENKGALPSSFISSDSPSSSRSIPSLDDPSSIQSIVLNTGDEVIPIFSSSSSSSPPVSSTTNKNIQEQEENKQGDGSSPLSSDFALPFFASRGRSGSKGNREEELENTSGSTSTTSNPLSGPSLLTTHFLPPFNQEPVTMKDVTANVMGKPVIVDEIANHGKLFRDSSSPSSPSSSSSSFGMNVGKENNNHNNLQLVPTTSPNFLDNQQSAV
jgi:hypothetical protein